MENASCGYGDKTVLQNLNLTIGQDEKIALLGSNGNGKSTLAKLLAGRIQLQSGKLTSARKLRAAYFAQHQAEEFVPGKTPYETVRELMPEAKVTQVYAHLAGYGLEKSKADTKTGNLSGGEKSRLLLSLITIEPPHVLILDEPTNHLDITSRRALIEALNDYTGAVILVTHDFHILESVCDRLLLVAGGGVSNFDGDLDDYKNYVLRGGGKNSGPALSEEDDRKDKRRKEAELRAQAAPLKKQLKDIEKKMESATAQKTELEKRLINGFNSDTSIELGIINKAIRDLEDKWIKVSTRLADVLK
ncbi:MAG TPA: ATP-binding cassette domain-containing protein [Elusimicrobiales bacterium]|nr:ATP-binding cassette domain-containing protein [Elusimicrobiales bacterium]